MPLSTVRTLWHMARGGRGADHEARLSDFYGPQAEGYDAFRERLLHGRAALIEALAPAPGSRIAEVGGGTARNLLFFGESLSTFANVDVIDLCRPLLDVAERRIAAQGWDNVRLHHADATRFRADEPYDVIYFSYSLSMIPDWWRALETAIGNLAPGGRIGVVDFYVSRRHPAAGRVRHGAWTRTAWPLWFRRDGVHLREDLLPYLEDRLALESCVEARGRLPYTPLRVPHCVVVGRPR